MSEPVARPSWAQWRQAALSRRMLITLVVIIAAAAVCIRLGAWQLDRAAARAEQGREAEVAAREEAPPVPIDEIVQPQTTFTQDMVGSRVEVSGTFAGPELFVSGKFKVDPSDPENKDLWQHGYWVLTPLRTSDGAILPVVRGWVEDPDPAYLNGDGLEVEVTGYLDGSEAAEDPVDGTTIGAVSSAQLINEWDSPIYSGFLILAGGSDGIDGSADSPEAADLPQIEAAPVPTLEGGGLNLQNLAYAAEWFIFGGFAVLIWWRMLRDEARGLAAPEPATDGHSSDERVDSLPS